MDHLLSDRFDQLISRIVIHYVKSLSVACPVLSCLYFSYLSPHFYPCPAVHRFSLFPRISLDFGSRQLFENSSSSYDRVIIGFSHVNKLQLIYF
jgi:hypothetical protein